MPSDIDALIGEMKTLSFVLALDTCRNNANEKSFAAVSVLCSAVVNGRGSDVIGASDRDGSDVLEQATARQLVTAHAR
jgi:hypothetical protein